MKYAIAENGEKIEAAPGAKGICSGCGDALIAKCGPIKINHWSHKGKLHCDPWWENETEWHREWKDHFSSERQEICLKDNATGEKHIADVRTESGIVVEFQHSFIKQEEMASREQFYKNMVWVVDGTRLKTDLKRFHKNKNNLRNIFKGVIFQNLFPEETLNKNWVERTKPVFFDFSGLGKNVPDGKQKLLFCLLPGRVGRGGVVLAMTQNDFVGKVNSGELTEYLVEAYNLADSYNKQVSQRAKKKELDLMAMSRNGRSGYRRRVRRRF